MLPHAQFGIGESNATSLVVHLPPHSSIIRIGCSRRCHDRRCVIRVILISYKFWQGVEISVPIFISEIFVQPIANHTIRLFHDPAFHIRILPHLNMNVLASQIRKRVTFYKFLALIFQNPNGAAASKAGNFRKFRFLEYRQERRRHGHTGL